MKEQLELILEFIRGAWRFRHQALLVAFGIAIPGWLYVMTLPNVWQCEARVYVDTDALLKPLLTGLAVDTNTSNRANLMSTLMLSEGRLRKLVAETGLQQR